MAVPVPFAYRRASDCAPAVVTLTANDVRALPLLPSV